jgi:hypothetical protein
MQKRDWIQQINLSLNMGVPFVYSSIQQKKSQLIFACDTFRRKNHDVILSIEPSIETLSILHIVIHPFQNCIDFTVTKKTTKHDIMKELTANTTKIRVRGCGTTIEVVLDFTAWAINNGWYIEKNIMNTLTQQCDDCTKKNTTLQIVLRKGSQAGTI